MRAPHFLILSGRGYLRKFDLSKQSAGGCGRLNFIRLLFHEIILTGFKNYASERYLFEKRVIGICGLNGKGKTNLLDALNYLCFTRSYFTRSDQMNVHFGADGFRLEGHLQNGAGQQKVITCIYRGAAKKEFLLDGIPYEKFSQHIGRFPCVFIAPDDIALITGGSEERRKFLDTLICQVDEDYLQYLISYNKVLAQRNSLLKYEAQRNRRDDLLLHSLDEQLIPAGHYIFQKRKQFSEQMFPMISRFYDQISGKAESIDLLYDSQLNEAQFSHLLKEALEKDRYTQRTNAGIHKDEISFVLHNNPFRQIASQGQRKSLLFACKLAEFQVLKQQKGFTPVLLLDDVFEKLDEKRVQNLLQFIIAENEGQVFITDTNAERLQAGIAGYDHELQIIHLD